MKIKMCAFIPKSLGSSLSMCDLPRGLVNQQSFDSEVRKIAGSWLKEPYPSTVFCGSDNRDFGNINGTNRIAAYNKAAIDLSRIGKLQSTYGRRSALFTKTCDPSSRAFVQIATSNLSIRDMDRYPRIPFQGGRFPVLDQQKHYGYVHLQGSMTGIAEQNPDTITDVNSDYSKIEVSTSAGYPYLEPFSPNIDFNFTVNLRRQINTYQVEITGSHNEFPCYELYINNLAVYQYRTQWKGPNAIDLNRSFSFTIRKQFLV